MSFMSDARPGRYEIIAAAGISALGLLFERGNNFASVRLSQE